ncbi:conserved hypothetical protein [Yersinia pestis biovar Antiqua str. UG05-0454]|nr:conserved hypothetical protein [Yersinia pestis biovar Antiqua str. UG05-0454]
MGRWWRYKWITFHPSLTLITVCYYPSCNKLLINHMDAMYFEIELGCILLHLTHLR